MRLKEILHLPALRQVRPFIRGIPKVVKFVVGLATVLTAATTIIGFVIFVSSRDEPVQEPRPEPTRPPPPEGSVDPDLLLSKVNSCELVPPEDGEDVISLLSLSYSIINKGVHDFEPSSVWVAAVSNELDGHRREKYVGKDEWVWDPVLQEYAIDSDIDLDVSLSDFGKVHRITISVDSPGLGSDSQVKEKDESNNDTVVLVRLPPDPPDEEYSIVQCSPP